MKTLRKKGLFLCVAGLVMQGVLSFAPYFYPPLINSHLDLIEQIGVVVLFVGMLFYLKSKGRHACWALMCILSVVGFIVLLFLKDKSCKSAANEKVVFFYAEKVFAISIVILVCLMPVGKRVFRLYKYHKVMNCFDNQSLLEITPSPIKLPENIQGDQFFTGYSQFVLNEELIDEVNIKGECIYIVGEGYKMVLMSPYSLEEIYEEAFNGYDGRIQQYLEDYIYEDDLFSSKIAIFRTVPVLSKELMLMTDLEFKLHFVRLLSKGAQSRIEKIEYYERGSLRGFINTLERNHINATMHSYNETLAQGMHFFCENDILIEEILLPILASYEFTVSEIPEDGKLMELIFDAVSANEKYVEDELGSEGE